MVRHLVRGRSHLLRYVEEAHTRLVSALEICLGKMWPNELGPSDIWGQTAARQYLPGARRAFAFEANSPCNIPGHSRYIDTWSPISCICRIGSLRGGFPWTSYEACEQEIWRWNPHEIAWMVSKARGESPQQASIWSLGASHRWTSIDFWRIPVGSVHYREPWSWNWLFFDLPSECLSPGQ